MWEWVWPRGAPDLSGSLRLDEVLVDFLGFGGHLDGILGLLEVLAGHPELNVLITELRLQEAAEGSQAIWWREDGGWFANTQTFYIQRQITVQLNAQTFASTPTTLRSSIIFIRVTIWPLLFQEINTFNTSLSKPRWKSSSSSDYWFVIFLTHWLFLSTV